MREKIYLLNDDDAQAAARSAEKVVQTHFAIVERLKAGITLEEVDRAIGEILTSLDCVSCFKGYQVGRLPPFPNHACLSVNECVVHGTSVAYRKPLKPGDILSIDVGIAFEGWMGDAAWTYAIEHASEDDAKLMDSGKASLRAGLEHVKPGRPYAAWANTVQETVERDYGFWCVRGLGGHGYGRTLHGPPYISNVGPSFSPWPEAFDLWKPGTLVALEPMNAAGTGATVGGTKHWPIYTKDGSRSVHYEADILVTADGHKNLTEGMWGLPDVVGG